MVLEFEMVKDFFMWCAIVNFCFMLFSLGMFMVFRKPIIKIFTKMYGLSEEKIKSKMFSGYSNYKILTFIFNIVPYLVLEFAF